MQYQTAFQKKVRITGLLIFETAFHIGSGAEGELATDMGVLKDPRGWPVLPGSTLKGNFRNTAEKLACHLDLSACMLDAALSGEKCIGDQGYFMKVNEEFKKKKNEAEKIEWLSNHMCNVCRLFGSPLHGGHIFFSDGALRKWQGGYQIRDGVVIDRDSGTARPRLKYDFEITGEGTAYDILIEMENPGENDLALVSAVLSEWERGFRIGGFKSRGLGQAVLVNVKTEQVDYGDFAQLKNYLLQKTMEPADDLLNSALQKALAAQGGTQC